MCLNGGIHPGKQCLPSALCAAQRLGNDLLHDAVIVQILRSQPHHGAGLTAAGGILPENAGKALRAEHRIDGIFQHQNMVGNAKAQCAAA